MHTAATPRSAQPHTACARGRHHHSSLSRAVPSPPPRCAHPMGLDPCATDRWPLSPHASPHPAPGCGWGSAWESGCGSCGVCESTDSGQATISNSVRPGYNQQHRCGTPSTHRPALSRCAMAYAPQLWVTCARHCRNVQIAAAARHLVGSQPRRSPATQTHRSADLERDRERERLLTGLRERLRERERLRDRERLRSRSRSRARPARPSPWSWRTRMRALRGGVRRSGRGSERGVVSSERASGVRRGR
jgi:hypothetical protein